MKTNLYLLAGILMISAFAKAQLTFSDATDLLVNNNLRSGVAMAVTDVNNDGLDDIIRLDGAQNLEIEYQQEDGSFTLAALGTGIGGPWGMTIADVDDNGFNDIILGGSYDDLKLLKADASGTSFTVETLDGPNIFLQNANFVDINNDGNIDFFGCHDDGLSNPYKNDGSGNLTYDLGLIDTSSTVASDNSGNYGSIWMDYDNDGDLDLYISKCRQGVDDPMDGRRLNLLFQNDGNNNFTDVAESAGLLPMTQTWSTNFEDIDNDGDLDAVIVNHFSNHQIYANNGDGTFTDITAQTGVETALQEIGFGIQVMMEDFDNNGFIDIYMTTTDGDDKILLNNGDITFTEAVNPFTRNGDHVQSAAVGDLNNDGFIDIIAGYASGFNNPSDSANDQLFLNNGNENNWIKLDLKGDESNSNGIGARIELYGDWGLQIREVRAGESYGTQNSLQTHFGIATATAIEKVIVRWPSGIVDEILEPSINRTLTVLEGENELSLVDFNTGDFLIYPNPTKGSFTVEHTRDKLEEITIYDVNGRKLEVFKPAALKNNIDVAHLSSGVYFVSAGNTYKRLVKQ
ncbi:FG-GAP-like repeat-containing protein [Dokdonia sinensis]|nr:FG-GAP-like repeat-containing protein [Dokdonia sinensis]